MGKAIDPFEDYLRRKKAELLQQKYRRPVADGEPPAESSGGIPSNDDPEAEARLREEAEQFFEEGGSAAAALFNDVDSGISDEKVDEIRDAIEDVFEEAPAKPQKEAAENFVQFFRQVEKVFDGPPSIAGEEIAVEVELEGAGEAEEPPAAVAPPPPPATTSPAPAAAPAARASQVTAVAREIAVGGEFSFSSDAPEVSSDEEDETQTLPEIGDGRLSLAEIFSRPAADEKALRQRIDLLCRLVARLVERAGIPESEIVESLIKSGVEF